MKLKVLRLSPAGLLEFAIIIGSLVLIGTATRDAWLSVVGNWLSHERLVYALATPEPAWGSWDLYGARTQTFTASSLRSWLLCSACAIAVWMAGCRCGKILRSLWLLAALLGVTGFVGSGDSEAIMVVILAVVMTWMMVRFGAIYRSETITLPSLKPVWIGVTLGLCALPAIRTIWRTSFADSPPTPINDAFLYIILTIIGASAAYFLLKAMRRTPVEGGGLVVGYFALLWYVGQSGSDIASVWEARHESLVRLTESQTWRELRAGLTATRLSESEASVQRLARPEVNSQWTQRLAFAEKARLLGAEGVRVSMWLAADWVLYASPPNQAQARAEVLYSLQKLPSDAAVDEIKAWLNLESPKPKEAAALFRRVIEATPNAPMPWLGLGLAETGAGRDDAATRALARWCTLDPRAVFSPVWNRAPLKRIRSETMRKWRASIESLDAAGVLTPADTARLHRFSGWLTAWEKAGGDVAKFLDDPVSPVPPTGAVRCVRERIRETLRDPSDAKIGASISAGTALLSERHVNLGQCHEIFKAMQTAQTGTASAKASIMISRVIMPEWKHVCRITEGGVGVTLHDFEENLVMRLLTYGLESAYISIPDKFLLDASEP